MWELFIKSVVVGAGFVTGAVGVAGAFLVACAVIGCMNDKNRG